MAIYVKPRSTMLFRLGNTTMTHFSRHRSREKSSDLAQGIHFHDHRTLLCKQSRGLRVAITWAALGRRYLPKCWAINAKGVLGILSDGSGVTKILLRLEEGIDDIGARLYN